MIPKGGRSRIFLQSRYGIQIADSWNVKLPKSNDMGGVYERGEKGKGFDGKAPMKNASFAPGICGLPANAWQLKVYFYYLQSVTCKSLSVKPFTYRSIGR